MSFVARELCDGGRPLIRGQGQRERGRGQEAACSEVAAIMRQMSGHSRLGVGGVGTFVGECSPRSLPTPSSPANM